MLIFKQINDNEYCVFSSDENIFFGKIKSVNSDGEIIGFDFFEEIDMSSIHYLVLDAILKKLYTVTKDLKN